MFFLRIVLLDTIYICISLDLSLAIDTGKPEHDTCPLCNILEDEFHVLLEN